jgi:ABC-type antimicrobial peptide transport system permease subunit
MFILSGTFAMLLAVLTVIFQSTKAATKNPIEALRYE